MRYRRIRWLLALLLATIVCHAQTSIDLIENIDGTWTLNAMPSYDVMMEVEYEDDLSQAIDLTDNGDGTWTIDQMPDYNVKLVVEYEDVTPPSVTIAPVAKTGLLYTGGAQQLITAGDAEGGVMVYSLDGINFSETIPTATEVGLYTVYYKAKSTVPNCGDSYVQTLSVRIVAIKTELNAVIEEAEAFYETIKNVLPVTAATLLNTINAAIAVQVDMDATQTEVDNAKETLSTTLKALKDTSIDLTDNGDGTWTLAEMPAYNVSIVVEYEDDLSQAIDLTDNGDGTWTLDQMPDYNVKLVVEYVDEQVNLTANSDGAGNYWVTYYNGEAGYSADDNTTVYTAQLSTDKAKVVLTEVTDRKVPAGNAVVMKSTAADIAMTYDATATGILADNELKGSDAALVTPENTYMLVDGASGVGFYHWTGSTVPVGKAYLTLDSGVALARAFIPFIEGEGGTMGVGIIPATEGNDDGTFYDLTGRKIGAKPTLPGIYVKNGKKVVVK